MSKNAIPTVTYVMTIITLWMSLAVHADFRETLKCGTDIIKLNDPMQKIIENCGDPDDTYQGKEQYVDTRRGFNDKYPIETNLVEILTYKWSGQFLIKIKLINGYVQSIWEGSRQ